MHAWAQPALPSLPGLPPIPGAPIPASPAATAPKINDSSQNLTSNSPSAPPSAAPVVAVPALQVTADSATTVPVVNVPATTAGNAAKPGSQTPPKLADTPPPKPESTENAAILSAAEAGRPELPTATPVIEPLPPLLDIPPIVGAGPEKMSGTPTKKQLAKPMRKTWETKLAPTSFDRAPSFQYKRVVMPAEIYRTRYNRENSHLPSRVTRADYEGLLFTSIARRDLNATRALLNAGTDIRARNAYGETPFAFARRIGAMDVAAVLAARGGR